MTNGDAPVTVLSRDRRAALAPGFAIVIARIAIMEMTAVPGLGCRTGSRVYWDFAPVRRRKSLLNLLPRAC